MQQWDRSYLAAQFFGDINAKMVVEDRGVAPWRPYVLISFPHLGSDAGSASRRTRRARCILEGCRLRLFSSVGDVGAVRIGGTVNPPTTPDCDKPELVVGFANYNIANFLVPSAPEYRSTRPTNSPLSASGPAGRCGNRRSRARSCGRASRPRRISPGAGRGGTCCRRAPHTAPA